MPLGRVESINSFMCLMVSHVACSCAGVGRKLLKVCSMLFFSPNFAWSFFSLASKKTKVKKKRKEGGRNTFHASPVSLFLLFFTLFSFSLPVFFYLGLSVWLGEFSAVSPFFFQKRRTESAFPKLDQDPD